MEDIHYCKNASMMRQYDAAITAVAYLYKNEFQKETNCLIPCSFTEYQVIFSIKTLSLHITVPAL